MSREDLAHTGLTVLQEAMNAAHLPGAGIVGSAITKAVEKRKAAAIEVLIDELEKGAASGVEFGEDDADAFVQMLLRFVKAVETGAAKDNLRLLAQVIVGLKRNRVLIFDKFQRWANILDTLTHDEIVFIGLAYRVKKQENREDFWAKLKEQAFATFPREQVFELSATVLRTGVLIPVSGFNELILLPSPSLDELCDLAQIEATAGQASAP